MKRTNLILLAFLFFSCNDIQKNNAADNHTDSHADSIEIKNLLQKVYKWHETNNGRFDDFPVIVKDSFQVGIDMQQVLSAMSKMSQTNFFTGDFLKNYERTGEETDSTLKHGKYYNEINFDFQESEPWTFFQDDAGNYYDSLIIHDLAIHADSASLKWTIKDMTDEDGYLVKLKHENNGWKITSLAGFDRK